MKITTCHYPDYLFQICLLAIFSMMAMPCFSENCLLTLEEAEIIAINNNPRLQQSRYQAESNYWVYRERLSRMFPKLTFSKLIGESNALPRESLFLGRYVRYQTETLRFDQLILSLPTYYDTKSSDWLFSAAFFNYMEEIVQTLANIRIAHYRVITTRQLIGVYQTLLDLYKESYENEEIKLTVGESTKFENIRNKLAYTNTLSDYYRAVANAEQAKDAWLKVLGVDPYEGMEYDIAEKEIPLGSIPFIDALFKRMAGEQGQITAPLFTEKELYYWKTVASFYRPVVKKFQAEYDSANMQVKGAWGSYVPEVSVFSNYTINQPRQFFDTRHNFNDHGIRIFWPLYDSFQRESRIYETKANRNTAKWASDEAWYTVQLEVYDRSSDLQQALYSVKSSEQSQGLSNEGIQQAKELLALGDLTLFEYRDMIQSLGRAELDLAQSRFDLIASYYSLLAAIGLQNGEAGMFLLKQGCDDHE